jgi:hypothetical protein
MPPGRVAEWLKAAVLKTAVGATPPWVRIPPLPPVGIECEKKFPPVGGSPHHLPHQLTGIAG